MPKLSAANSASSAMRRGMRKGPSMITSGPAAAKKACDASQTPTAGAARLNRTRRTVRVELCMRNDSIRPSIPAVTAPAAGPITRAAAVLKVSETEKLIGIAGTGIASQPTMTVSARSTTRANDTGPVRICQVE